MNIGLALSGGGVKGATHIGVLQALEENEVKISTISGTSIGSIVASLYAMGYTTDEMLKLFKYFAKTILKTDPKYLISNIRTKRSILGEGIISGQAIEDAINECAKLKNIKYIKDILLYKATNHVALYSEEEKNKIKEISEIVEKERLINLVYELSELENEMKFSTQKNIVFQAGMIKLCSNLSSRNNEGLEQRVTKIEKYLKNNHANVQNNVPVNTEIKMTYTTNTAPVTTKNPTKTTNNKQVQNRATSYSNKVEEYWPQIVQDLKQNGKIIMF